MWEKPKVSLSMKTYMNVTIEETDIEKNVLRSVSVTVPRDASSEYVEAALKAELAEQDTEADEVTILEAKLNTVSMAKEI